MSRSAALDSSPISADGASRETSTPSRSGDAVTSDQTTSQASPIPTGSSHHVDRLVQRSVVFFDFLAFDAAGVTTRSQPRPMRPEERPADSGYAAEALPPDPTQLSCAQSA